MDLSNLLFTTSRLVGHRTNYSEVHVVGHLTHDSEVHVVGHLTHDSEVHALGDVALLLVERLLLGLPHVGLRHLHAALAQGEHAGLRAHRLDVCATEVVLGHHELLKIHVVRERHLAGMDLEDAPLGLLVGQRELDLAVNAAWTDHGRIQGLDAVGGHDHLHVATIVEAVQLVEQFQHRALDLLLATAGRVVPLGGHCVDLVDEHNGGRVLLRDAEHLTDQLRPITQVFLN
mmetsp:Transcript_46588/g.120614  ORF Transcript_46588/g.120614 Transcript_46588/m.120614 type:complete len:231 (+) Transcript_46588:90-782(+)